MKEITVKAEPFAREHLAGILKSNDIHINAYAEMLFAHPAFSTECVPSEVRVVIASLRELGFVHGAFLNEIFDCLPAYGLRPCHLNTGLFLRLAWQDQKQSRDSLLSGSHRAPDSAVTVLSRPPEENDAFPKGLYLRNVDGRLWLRGYICDASYRWSADDLFAFEK